MATETGRRYQTRQRELVLDCIRATPDAYVSARQVAQRLAEQGQRVGTATVYRNLERLEAEGCIVKSTVEGTGGTCYRYLPEAPEQRCGCSTRSARRAGGSCPSAARSSAASTSTSLASTTSASTP